MLEVVLIDTLLSIKALINLFGRKFIS